MWTYTHFQFSSVKRPAPCGLISPVLMAWRRHPESSQQLSKSSRVCKEPPGNRKSSHCGPFLGLCPLCASGGLTATVEQKNCFLFPGDSFECQTQQLGNQVFPESQCSSYILFKHDVTATINVYFQKCQGCNFFNDSWPLNCAGLDYAGPLTRGSFRLSHAIQTCIVQGPTGSGESELVEDQLSDTPLPTVRAVGASSWCSGVSCNCVARVPLINVFTGLVCGQRHYSIKFFTPVADTD